VVLKNLNFSITKAFLKVVIGVLEITISLKGVMVSLIKVTMEILEVMGDLIMIETQITMVGINLVVTTKKVEVINLLETNKIKEDLEEIFERLIHINLNFKKKKKNTHF